MPFYSSYALLDALPPQGRGGERGVRHRARQVQPTGLAEPVRLQRYGLERELGTKFERALLKDVARREAVAHPSVLKTLELGVAEGQLYATSELEAGLDIESLLQAAAAAGGRPSFDQSISTAWMLVELGLALEKIAGNVLLVLRPSDVILTWTGQVQLRAIGRIGAQAHLIAPELRKKERTSEKTTVWAVGRLLRCLLSGGMEKGLKPRVPGEYATAMKPILSRMLASEPIKRFTLQQAHDALGDLLTTLEVSSACAHLAHGLSLDGRPVHQSRVAQADASLTPQAVAAVRSKLDQLGATLLYEANVPPADAGATGDATVVRPPGSSISSDVFYGEAADSSELAEISGTPSSSPRGVSAEDDADDADMRTEMVTPDVIAEAIERREVVETSVQIEVGEATALAVASSPPPSHEDATQISALENASDRGATQAIPVPAGFSLSDVGTLGAAPHGGKSIDPAARAPDPNALSLKSGSGLAVEDEIAEEAPEYTEILSETEAGKR